MLARAVVKLKSGDPENRFIGRDNPPPATRPRHESLSIPALREITRIIRTAEG